MGFFSSKNQIFVGVGVFFFLLFGIFAYGVPKVKTVLAMAKNAGTTSEKWEEVYAESRMLPPIYPFSAVKKGVFAVNDLLLGKKTLAFLHLDPFKGISAENLDALQYELQQGVKNVKALVDLAQRMPMLALSEPQQHILKDVMPFLEELPPVLDDIAFLNDIITEHRQKDARILVLLMNDNERRPMGGFAGSFFTVDFNETGVKVDFSDVYALDRLIPDNAKRNAPGYFHHLSKEISLRDVNLVPDFARASEEIRIFFESAGQKPPETVIAMNMQPIRAFLQRAGPVFLPGYGVTLTADNFDLVLSTLVEGKAAGRYSVKEPVLLFAEKLFTTEKLAKIPLRSCLDFPFRQFIINRSVMVQSSLKKTKKFAETQDLLGEVVFEDADLQMFFEIINVGANKTDKFMWTHIDTVSTVQKKGWATHNVRIKHTHALKQGELDTILGLQSWPQNLKRLVTPHLRWVLGEGVNKTVFRVWVPRKAELLGWENKAGLNEVMNYERNFKVYELPLSVKPTESGQILLTFRTKVNRGSQDWRPYAVDVGGTNGLERVFYKQEIVFSPDSAEVLEKTANLGMNIPLRDHFYRTVGRFDGK